MNSMGVRAALSVFLLFIATVKAGEGGVTFWKETFTMTCPENGNWYRKGLNVLNESETDELMYNATTKGSYYCEYSSTEADQNGDAGQPAGVATTKYYFYVKGKVCANCFELNAVLFGLAIVADVVGTAIVMMIIYRCTKKKSSAGPTHTFKAPARPGGRAPPVPSPDYDLLNPHTRSQDPYAFVNRTG